MYVLIYIDDLLVAGATEEITKEVANQLYKEFSIKDLGSVSHYLGIQIQQEDNIFVPGTPAYEDFSGAGG